MTTHPGRLDPSPHPAVLGDDAAQAVLEAVMHLAVVLRDDPAEVRAAADAVLALAGDPVAAVCVAATLVNVDDPIDAWWQAGLDGLRSVPAVPSSADSRPGVIEHGSHRGYNQHRAAGEPACEACLRGESEYSSGRRRVRRLAVSA